jgi:squalene-hopene/tetraprenyl-beta-curcumene cyclase
MRASLLIAFMLPVYAFSAEPTTYPKPKPTNAEEAIAKVYSPQKAGSYLDSVGVNWTRERRCVTCHTNMPYLMARPLLQGDDGWKEVRQFLVADVKKWETGAKPRGEAYVVATAAGLVFTDIPKGKLSAESKQALAKMWSVQRKTGEWSWLKCDWPPLEHDDYYGAVLAATIVAYAPEKYSASPEAQEGLKRLKEYLSKTPAPDLHHKAHLLWASVKLDGLMTPEVKNQTIAELKKLQREDGGWSLPSLGRYMRRDKSPNEANAPSDGYATGYVTYILKQAGVVPTDPSITKGIAWLKNNQRESGRWFTRSLNNDRDHFIANAGSAFAVMALEGK